MADDLRKKIKEARAHKIALLGLPWDESSSFLRGPEDAPQFIRRALISPSANIWTESGSDLSRAGVYHDFGDLGLRGVKTPPEAIETAAALLLRGKGIPIFLGGDHAVTYPLIRAFARKYKQLTILHFDAHPDLYDELGGNRYSHACPFARIMEEKLARRLVQVGIRTVNGHQREQARRFGVEMVEMRHFSTDFIGTLKAPLYISFDMDVLDPAFAPGVSHHEPGGLSTRQVIDMLHAIKTEIVGADLVEFNPRRDWGSMTAMVAAKILKELMGIMLWNRKAPRQ